MVGDLLSLEFVFFHVLYVLYFFTFKVFVKLFLFKHHLNQGSMKRKLAPLRNNFSP